MGKIVKNAYDAVEEFLRDGKFFISENELDYYEDRDIILAILKSKYNAKYIPSEDYHFCGEWSFDNPYLKKKEHYQLEYCYFEESTWKSCSMTEKTRDKAFLICQEVIRLDTDHCEIIYNEKKVNQFETECKDIFTHILKNKIYVGNNRFWRIREVLYY